MREGNYDGITDHLTELEARQVKADADAADQARADAVDAMAVDAHDAELAFRGWSPTPRHPSRATASIPRVTVRAATVHLGALTELQKRSRPAFPRRTGPRSTNRSTDWRSK